MAKKIKLHGRTVYPFPHLTTGSSFITDKKRNTVMTAYRKFNQTHPTMKCEFETYTDGTTKVTRIQ